MSYVRRAPINPPRGVTSLTNIRRNFLTFYRRGSDFPATELTTSTTGHNYSPAPGDFASGATTTTTTTTGSSTKTTTGDAGHGTVQRRVRNPKVSVWPSKHTYHGSGRRFRIVHGGRARSCASAKFLARVLQRTNKNASLL